MKDLTIAITAASYSGNKGAAAMLQSSIRQLKNRYGERLVIYLMSVYPGEDRKQVPWDFVKVVPCKPQNLLFIAFPLSVLFALFRWCPPVRALLLKNKILKAYSQVDLVLDEAGISFVDSRGFVMNTYAFVCAAVPLLVGVPVAKYSQALGTFHSFSNRFLAKWILPKLSLICARGRGTLENLREIGIVDNVKLCTDGAFTMEDTPESAARIRELTAGDSFYNDNVVGLSISSVVEKKCRKLGINYAEAMIRFVTELLNRGYHVLIIANSARIHSDKPRNNDLMICREVYAGLSCKEQVRWYDEEMDAEEIRELIGRCRFLVASRFHAMIGALQRKVPVFLIGWSHKYQEILDFFELGSFVIDFSALSVDSLLAEFERFVGAEKEIRRKLDEHYEEVMESSRKNILYVSEILDGILSRQEGKPCGTMLDTNHPETYLGEWRFLRKGYALDETIRDRAASGGLVTAFLCYLLRTHQIDGAWVTTTKITNGSLSYDTHIAVTEEEIRDASSSTYASVPMLKHIDMVRKFRGKLAVVMIPCQLSALESLMKKEAALRDKIVLKIGLYCSGNQGIEATGFALKKQGISLEGAKRFYYRQGHWRGQSAVVYEDGTEKSFSYTRTVCTFRNAYFFENSSCMTCQDQYAYDADISFGDVWLSEMKQNPIKHSSCIVRSGRAAEMYRGAKEAGVWTDSHISARDMVRSQKRALAFKFNCAPAKQAYYQKTGRQLKLRSAGKSKWNHRLAFYLARKNEAFSRQHPDRLMKIPQSLLYYYMCFIRALLSF